jgi:ATP-binding cassette subfamily F protein uup
MSALIYGQNMTKAYGTKRLFQELTLGISEKDRIGIIGPNGSGKSTLLRIFAGLEQPDEGRVTRRQHLRIAYIPQQAAFDSAATVAEEIERAALASGLSAHEGVSRVQETLGKMGFAQGDQLVGPLSGGWKKRLAIACGFVQAPDVMLVDEPTNHLDLEGMRWLEQIMSQASWPWIMVSHDRWFLEHATNKVAELNACYPDGILLVPGTYREFLMKREEFLVSQHQQAQALAGKVRREEEWLRRGPKARTTKAKYRVDSAHALQAELAETKTRLRQEETGIDFVGSGRRTKQLIVVQHLCKAFGERRLIHDLDWVISPGTATGILGYNGSGKSTLLKLLAKELEPDRGGVIYADKLQVVYFDQHREQLNPKMTLRRTLSDSGHTVTYRGQTVHLARWAKRFRFQPEQLDLPVELLSGGEQARAVIARLMLQPADVLIVDEPTNDLDIPTREVLEESLKEFSGALVLVTHDRYMLQEVCSEFVGLDGKGGAERFADYRQWEAWLRRVSSGKDQLESQVQKSRTSEGRPKTQKLSFRDQQEYDKMETRVLEAETALEQWRAKITLPAIASDHLQLQEVVEAMKAAEQEVERLYTRWAELEAKQQSLSS